MHPGNDGEAAAVAGESAHAAPGLQLAIKWAVTAGALFLAFFHFYTSIAGTF